MTLRIEPEEEPGLTFADVFAGCGGLSLGLANAGWKGRFAVEKNADAFSTLAANLVQGRRSKKKFDWPEWLPQSAISTTNFLGKYSDNLKAMKGRLTLLAGGPPCQGFSLAGRRTQSDPRNALTDDYIEMVKLLQPRFLLIENVKGFTLPFKKNTANKADVIPYSQRVTERLEAAGYVVYSDLIDLSLFGVPQSRKRFILIAVRKNDPALEKLKIQTPIDLLNGYRKRFLANKGLNHNQAVTVKEAIGDLETDGKELIKCDDSPYKSYVQVKYDTEGFHSPFIKLMRRDVKIAPNSLRLPKHEEATRSQFKAIMTTCTQGRTISDADRARLNLKKHALTPLKSSMPSATITTLPDDMIHYSEPRILTARENARLQTFPDTFQFLGKYTTGGANRKIDCPRYTQIGNAVPPLFAEALGHMLKQLAS
ncbi:DNA cytosine methyltransferase [Variovorax sp. LT1R20]|uniref:DNA cytosine methyltransferase n=1 Tax=Variovorax sp. LT1R20 TaxID=3443729 RepID=UPI003F44F3AC